MQLLVRPFLREVEAGATGKTGCRHYGISEQTLYRWKAGFGGMQVSDARRLKQLEQGNGRLKRLVADLALVGSRGRRYSKKKLVKPAAKRLAVAPDFVPRVTPRVGLAGWY
ncbi:MAG: transposase [Gammaproteobacteria bacterium]